MRGTIDMSDASKLEWRPSCASCDFGVSSGTPGRWRCRNPGTMFPGQFFVGPEACEGHQRRVSAQSRRPRSDRATARFAS